MCCALHIRTTRENGIKIYDEQSIGDAAVEAKWRLFEKNSFNSALKPGVTLPTGNDEKGLGAGQLEGVYFSSYHRNWELWPYMAMWFTFEMKTRMRNAKTSGMFPWQLLAKP